MKMLNENSPILNDDYVKCYKMTHHTLPIHLSEISATLFIEFKDYNATKITNYTLKSSAR